MITIFQKLFDLRLLVLISLVTLTNIVNAQWVKVYDGGIPTCITSDREYIYVGFHGGYYHPGDTAAARNIIRSSDYGTTWENVSNGLTSGSMYSLNVQALFATGNKIFAGTRNGIFISSNHGDNWIKTKFDPLNGEVNALLVVDSLIFAGSVDDRIEQTTKPGLFISSDEGQSWVRSDSGIMCPNCGVYPSVYAFARIGSTIFAGTSQGDFSSDDKGKTWIWDTSGVPAISFAVIDSTLFMGHSYASFISRSTDMGISWIRCDSGLSERGVRYLAASAKNLFGGSLFDGIYYSSDMGNRWKPINEGLGEDDSSSLSDDISSIGVIDNNVFAGSIGLWRRPLSEITSVVNVNQVFPKGFELKQNYPNPFNPSTVISYHLSMVSDVSLRVYDLLGREIAVLVNKKQTSGEHSVKFDANIFPSGVYFYHLKVNGYEQTKKMILIR